MILESIRSITDALDNVSYGVDVQLSNVSRDTTDTIPSALAGVFDETRSDEVAVGRFPEVFPSLVVTLEGTVNLQGEVISSYRDAEISVMVRYVQDDTDGAKARTDAYYTLRAVEKCLRVFFSNLQAADRLRNNVQILECKLMEHVPMFDNINDGMVTSGIRVVMYVRDIQP